MPNKTSAKPSLHRRIVGFCQTCGEQTVIYAELKSCGICLIHVPDRGLKKGLNETYAEPVKVYRRIV